MPLWFKAKFTLSLLRLMARMPFFSPPQSAICFPLYGLAFHSWIMFKVRVINIKKKKKLFPSAKSQDGPQQASSCYCYLVINILDTILAETSFMPKPSIRIFLTVSLSTFSVSAIIYSLHCQYKPIYALFSHSHLSVKYFHSCSIISLS
jgi:hypothetical protein